MLEMITEITGEYLQASFRISEAPMIKFLRMIDPAANPLIRLEINYRSDPEKKFLDGRIFFELQIFMKFQLSLTPDPVQ
jgi:hypothetical protein